MIDRELQRRVEQHLLGSGDWVTAKELCELFDVNDRALRAVEGIPGLCTLIAISGNRGYKHAALATTAEWREHEARERRHNIMGLVNLRAKRRRRQAMIKEIRTRQILEERDSRQVLMPGVVNA